VPQKSQINIISKENEKLEENKQIDLKALDIRN